jgi:TRAP-type transport system periplasmic protein
MNPVRAIMAASVVGLMGGTAFAADLPEMTVKGIGLNSKTIASFGDEVPFWKETIPEASGGKITAEFSPVDLMGVKDPQVMRMSSLGVVDFASGDISKMAGDDPVFEGCDLAGLALDLETARKACDAWAPVMDRVMQEKFNVKMLAFGANPPQVFWCREELSGIEDLAGKKTRVFNKTMTDFISAVGGTTVSLPFAEVVPALQRGVVDCAVTGTLSGNTAGWPEVSGYLYPMYMGWSINYQSANLDKWNSWPKEVQDFFTEQFDEFQETMWSTVREATQQGELCNFGKDGCTLGKPADMELVPVSDEDKVKHKELMENVVLVEWGKRCGKDCASEWNETVGKVVGLEIPVDKL